MDRSIGIQATHAGNWCFAKKCHKFVLRQRWLLRIWFHPDLLVGGTKCSLADCSVSHAFIQVYNNAVIMAKLPRMFSAGFPSRSTVMRGWWAGRKLLKSRRSSARSRRLERRVGPLLVFPGRYWCHRV